jgi:hypothetical protein
MDHRRPFSLLNDESLQSVDGTNHDINGAANRRPTFVLVNPLITE